MTPSMAELERAHVESAGTGPPLALLHGWAMRSGLFAPLLPRLERYRVYLVDLPGHGRSAGPGSPRPYTLEAIAGAAHPPFLSHPEAFLDALAELADEPSIELSDGA